MRFFQKIATILSLVFSVQVWGVEPKCDVVTQPVESSTSEESTFFYPVGAVKESKFSLEGRERIAKFDNVYVRSVSRYVDILKLMSKYTLTYLQAVDVQAFMSLQFVSPSKKEIDSIVERVRSGATTTGVNIKVLEDAKFILALDLDHTLIDQNSIVRWDSKYHQYGYNLNGLNNYKVAAAPNWYNFILRAKLLGGAVVIYSRNTHEVVHHVTEKISYQGKSIKQSVDGIFTNLHLVVRGNGSAFVKYKELAIFGHPEKTILVDDHITRATPVTSIRRVPPFRLPVKRVNKRLKSLMSQNIFSQLFTQSDHEFEMILSEIDESIQASEDLGISFAQSFSVYSAMGKEVIEILLGQSTKWDSPMKLGLIEDEFILIKELRLNPEVIPFVVKNKLKKR